MSLDQGTQKIDNNVHNFICGVWYIHKIFKCSECTYESRMYMHRYFRVIKNIRFSFNTIFIE